LLVRGDCSPRERLPCLWRSLRSLSGLLSGCNQWQSTWRILLSCRVPQRKPQSAGRHLEVPARDQQRGAVRGRRHCADAQQRHPSSSKQTRGVLEKIALSGSAANGRGAAVGVIRSENCGGGLRTLLGWSFRLDNVPALATILEAPPSFSRGLAVLGPLLVKAGGHS
jgi:hypothetical protein